MSTHDPLIEIKDVSLGWGERTLLENLNFQVMRGEIFVILGGSGSGKSTLLHHIIGLDEPQKGEIKLNLPSQTEGHPPYGVMFQSGALLGSLTVGENVALALEEWTELPAPAVDAMVQAKLRLVGLEGTEGKLPAELSGGMKKRAAIARAMILEPSLLFLDEPSAGLDPVTAAELDELILRLNRALATTIVMVTHDLDSILSVGTRCVMLDRDAKGIIAEGAPRELKEHSKDPRVKAFFHRTAREAA
jgi:phospholipid/cholesterol/gamma-HCH transport system ATP-binding protein